MNKEKPKKREKIRENKDRRAEGDARPEPAELYPIPVTDDTVKAIAFHHFKKDPKKFSQLTTGLANTVYEVDMGENNKYIFRISELPLKFGYYLKEQWAVGQAKDRGVPVPDILEVGNEVVPNPYMVVQKVEGINALQYPDKNKVIDQMGRFAALINTIPTTGFGQVFDWSNNKLSKKETWKQFMREEWDVPLRLEILDRNKMLSKENFKKLKDAVREMEKWDKSPTLNHCDIRLKNMIVNKEGKIVAVLDWENCSSLMSPHWELSIALHDLNIDEKQIFLDGYGIRPNDFEKMAERIKVINLLNYAHHVQSKVEKDDKQTLERYRLRLNGIMDLYSI